ncbi:hypothetical protein ACMXYN_11685 [Neptuniibacter sp. PT8_73]|uniref:hypothetical protein n=1 Tax=unclassified Neptuniibacter TaxID=2630693 RepID=UPI0039F6ABD2
MDSKCNHCRQLIESSIISEPHQHLNVQRRSMSSSIYRCQLCNTMFEFTEHEIYLLDIVQPESEITEHKPSACA